MLTRRKSVYTNKVAIVVQDLDQTEQQSDGEQIPWREDMLTISYVPKIIPARNQQKQVIYQFIKDCLTHRINRRVLYISGVPGVGKSISAIEVIQRLKCELKPNTTFFHFINATQCKAPNLIYNQIYKLISAERNTKGQNFKKVSVDKTIAVLDQFIQVLKKNHVVVIDEVDFLLTANQKIFYNLFEWTSQATTKLTLIIIANTLDFPERLSPKINSRMGDNRLVFKPYNQNQINTVVQDRLKNCKSFDNNAITYACNKTVSFSSDVRKVLSIMHSAYQQAMKTKAKRVTIGIMAKTWRELNQIDLNDFRSEFPAVYNKVIDFLQSKDRVSSFSAISQMLQNQSKCSLQDAILILKDMQEMNIIDNKCPKSNRSLDYEVNLLI